MQRLLRASGLVSAADQSACSAAPRDSEFDHAGLPITIGVPAGRSATAPGFTFSYAPPVVSSVLALSGALISNGGAAGVATTGQNVTILGNGFGSPALGNATVIFAGDFTLGLPLIISQSDGTLVVSARIGIPLTLLALCPLQCLLG